MYAEDDDGLVTVLALRSLAVDEPAADLESGDTNAVVLVPLRVDCAAVLTFDSVSDVGGERRGGETGALVVALDQCDVGLESVVVLDNDASDPIRAEDASDPVGEPDDLWDGTEDISARHRTGTAPISMVMVLRPLLDGYRRCTRHQSSP